MKAFVAGVGKTKFSPTQKTLPQLMQEAALGALDDSNLGIGDIDAIIVSNFLGGPNERQLHLNSVVAGIFPGVNLPAWRVEAACASGGAAIHQAILALSRYKRVLVIGVEKLSDTSGTKLTRNIGMAGDRYLDQEYGLTFPANYALLAQMYFDRYGASTDDLDLVSLKNHQNAQKNPLAHFNYKTIREEDFETSPVVASPLRLLDCCPISDGAAALVLEDTRGSEDSLEILASTVATDAISLAQRDDTTSFLATRKAAQAAYQEAGLEPEDIDFLELHDCFTIAELVALEDLGFAERGQAPKLTREGATKPDGSIPANVSGGLKAGGHAIGATGIGQIYELVQQIRGRAGERQLKRARRGLAQNVGGIGGTCTITIVGG